MISESLSWGRSRAESHLKVIILNEKLIKMNRFLTLFENHQIGIISNRVEACNE